MAFNYCLQIRESLHFKFQNYFFLLQYIGKWPDGDALWFPSLLEACKPATSPTTFRHFDPVSSELNARTPGVSEALRKEKGLTWHFWMWGSKEPWDKLWGWRIQAGCIYAVYRVKQNKNTNPLNQEHDMSEHWLVTETPGTEPKATSMLFLSLTARQTSDQATAFTFQSCTGGIPFPA